MLLAPVMPVGARMPLPPVGLMLRCSTRFVPPRVRMVAALLKTGTVEALMTGVTLFTASVIPASVSAVAKLTSCPMIFCAAFIVNTAVAYVPLSTNTRSMPLEGAASPSAVASEQGAVEVQLVPAPVGLTKTQRLLTDSVIVPVDGVPRALSILYLNESVPVKLAGGV